MWDYLQQNWIQVLGVVLGIIYLIQELKANIWMWITGIIMPVISSYVYFTAGLYADFGIEVYYFFAAIYGFAVWKWGKTRQKKQIPIGRTPLSAWPVIAGATAILWIALYLILSNFTNSTVPVCDGFTTALSIVATVMLARKWVEQWWAWFVVDAVCVALYIYKGIYFYAGLYLLYTILAVVGYYKWKRMISST